MRSGDVLSALLYLLTGSNTTVGVVQVRGGMGLEPAAAGGVPTLMPCQHRCLCASDQQADTKRLPHLRCALVLLQRHLIE